mgnify:CR=1 FL=1
MDNRNVFIAIALSMSVLLFWAAFFETPRMIASKVNEDSKLAELPGAKSFTLEFTLDTDNENVSPVVDVYNSNLTGDDLTNAESNLMTRHGL